MLYLPNLFKLLFTLLIASGLLLVVDSCNQPDQTISLKNKMIKKDNYTVGDCFEFKERINDFGVIFLEEQIYPDGKQYNLFPVKLDTTKTGLDRFKYGKVYVTSFLDFTKSGGRTEGIIVYHFLYQKNFELINQYFTYSGSLSIKDGYKNSTGGTVAESFDDFRTQLNLWDKMFGANGRLVSVAEIIN